MKYTIEQLGFILYNNRSVEGVVQNFLDPTINPFRLIQIEKKFDWCKSLYSNLEKMVEVDLSLLKPDSDDEIVTPEQLESVSELTLSNLGKFSNVEKDFLIKRNIQCSTYSTSHFLRFNNRKIFYINANNLFRNIAAAIDKF